MLFKWSMRTLAPDSRVADLYDEMRSWRRHLHANPELSFEEYETTAFIQSLLNQWGLPYDSPLPTATVVHLHGVEPGPVLLVRADIDALPIQEENPVEYASNRPGVMHACGHDGHTAILLGLAKYLSQRRGLLRGEVRLLFQHAEEVIPSGAPAIVEAGVLTGVMAAVGLHLWSLMDTGTMSLTSGPVMASDDRFDVTIIGAGGHAGLPHQTTNALAIAAGLVSQLETLVSRRVDPVTPAVVTIGSLHAGNVYNAISGEAWLSGTVRALSPSTRDQLESELVRFITAYAAAHEAEADVQYQRGSPTLTNNAGVVDFARPAAEASVGALGVVSSPPFMGGEDFAFYAERVPAVFAFIGAGGLNGFPQHHPLFDIDERALAIGLDFLKGVVDRWTNPTSPIPDMGLG